MTKHSDSSPLLVQHAWRGFPNRLKELIKRNATMPPLTPPMSFSEPNKSILNRLFSKSSKKDNDKNNNKYDNEWDNYTDVPLRAMTHPIPLLTQVHQQQDHPNAKVAMANGNTNNTNSNNNNQLGYIYVTTLAKLKNLNHYTLIQQLSLHKLVVSVQKAIMNNNNGLYNIKLFQRDCLSILTNSAAATATAGIPKGVTSDFILSRKPAQSKRTRYIYMLLSTPASEVKDYVHPVAEAYKRLRRPYAETATVISSDMEEERPVLQDDDDSLNRSHSLSSGSSSSCSSEITISVENTEKDDAKTFKFVPADFLLDPATLRRKSDTRTPGSKFGTKLNQHDGPLEPQFIFDDPILKKKRAKSILTRFKLKNMDKIQMDEVKDNYYVI